MKLQMKTSSIYSPDRETKGNTYSEKVTNLNVFSELTSELISLFHMVLVDRFLKALWIKKMCKSARLEIRLFHTS